MENGVSNGVFILTDDGILRESCVASGRTRLESFYD